MTKREAVAVNSVLLALLAQKQTLSMVGIGIGMTAFPGEVSEAATVLADGAFARIGMGLDKDRVARALASPKELDRVIQDIKQEALLRCA